MFHPGETGGKPSDKVLAASRIRREAAGDPNMAGDLAYADRYEQRARSKEMPTTIEGGAGGELVDTEKQLPDTPNPRALVNTVTSPDYVTAEASEARLELAHEAGALGQALDFCDTINARDSLEKALMHQMATIHRGAMKMAKRMNEEIERAGCISEAEREARNVRACRYAGAISRLMLTYQQGIATLDRKRSGGRQRVEVVYQQVNVEDGGQAVVAGRGVTAGPRGARRGGRGGSSGGGAKNG